MRARRRWKVGCGPEREQPLDDDRHVDAFRIALERERGLVQQLGLRDLGVGRGDLALVRPTWQPSILTEGLYMIVPEQEAALRSTEGQRRYALGVLDGLRAWFLEETRR